LTLVSVSRQRRHERRHLFKSPDRFLRRLTVKFRRAVGDFSPADEWSYTVYLAGAKPMSADGVADGTCFRVTFTADTPGLNAGTKGYV